MTTLRYSAAGARLALAAILAGSLLVVLPAASAHAAQSRSHHARVVKHHGHHAKADTKKAKAKRAESAKIAKSTKAEYTSGLVPATPTEDARGCQRPRKRLWVDGEGWIIRRVTLCP